MIRIRKQYEILKRKTVTIHYPGNNAFHFPPVLPALNHSLSEASFSASFLSIARNVSRKPVEMNCVHRVEVGLAPFNDTLVHHTVYKSPIFQF
jgi:hypothetical protein